MKPKNAITILAVIALVFAWSCQKDQHLVDPTSENQELLKKKPVPEPEPEITITSLGSLPDGLASCAYGLNVVNGDIWVVGTSYIPLGGDEMTHAMVWKQSTGIMEDIGPGLGGVFSEAQAVNNEGIIVGNTQIAGAGFLAVMWQADGTVVNLENYIPSTCPDSRADAINVNGVILGSATPGVDCKQHMWAWDPPATTDLGNLNLEGAFGTGINASGAIVGCLQPTISEVDLRAAYSATGLPGSLGILTGFENIYSEATDINDNFQIVGHYIHWNDARCFLWENGSYIELPSLGGHANAYAISEGGYVTGESKIKKNNSGPGHAFLWHADIGIIDLGTLEGGRTSSSVGYDVIEHPSEANTVIVAGWSDSRAVMWTVDLTSVL